MDASIPDQRATLEQRLAEVEERLDRAGKRLTAGYGSDSDRDGWLLWLRQLEAQRAVIVGRLRELGDDGPSRSGRAPSD